MDLLVDRPLGLRRGLADLSSVHSRALSIGGQECYGFELFAHDPADDHLAGTWMSGLRSDSVVASWPLELLARGPRSEWVQERKPRLQLRPAYDCTGATSYVLYMTALLGPARNAKDRPPRLVREASSLPRFAARLRRR